MSFCIPLATTQQLGWCLSYALHTLAELARARGQYEAAKALYERALRILEQAFGAEHPVIATVLQGLAELVRAQEQRVPAAGRKPEHGVQDAHSAPLVETSARAPLQQREQHWRVVLAQAEPGYRAQLERLIAAWEAANQAYYQGALEPPYLLLAEPTNPRRLGDCSLVSGWGEHASQIRLRPSLLAGTHPLVRDGSHDAEGLLRFVEDVLLHEQIHQWQQEVTKEPEGSYHGHGPRFCVKCNEIGARLGLAPVIVRTRPGQPRAPRCAHWPHNVRPPDYYRGAYVPARGDAAHRC